MNNSMKVYRNNLGYTQQYVAKKLGITVSSYNMIENGRRNPSLVLAKKISLIFEATIDEIFFNSYVHNKQL